MNKKIIIGIVIAAGVLLLAVLILLIIALRQPQPATDTQTNETTTTTDVTTTTNSTTTSTTDTTTTETTQPVEQDDRQAITAAARSFTERFGSYSTDTNFENIELSRYLMTESMSKQSDKIIDAGQTTAKFTSVTSAVTGVTLTDFADGATGATVEVAVRQKTTVGQADATYSNVTARLTLKKVSNTWKIDSFRWL
ncbi:MAG TPA: hypothetical protein DEG44_06045 [Candidatus Kerfeldbacteria bacterium]|nr:hypothetical protein [Candidatus Kerfeldbacteria bacterium]